MIAIGSAQESDTSKALPKAVECLSYSRRAARVDAAVDIAVGAAVGVGVAADGIEAGYLSPATKQRQKCRISVLMTKSLMQNLPGLPALMTGTSTEKNRTVSRKGR